MSVDIARVAKEFAEAQPPHAGKPAAPAQSYKLRSPHELVIILADGRKKVIDPEKPFPEPDPQPVGQADIAALTARIVELERQLAEKPAAKQQPAAKKTAPAKP
jgi:hypothetical protein